MEKSIMDDILNQASELKKIIEKSNEYKEYIKMTKKLEKNSKVNDIIDEIKKKQQLIVKMENNKENTELEEEKLNILFEQLNNIPEYKEYLKASKILNKLITKVQDNFSKAFNDILN